jgi:hypothetical protein
MLRLKFEIESNWDLVCPRFWNWDSDFGIEIEVEIEILRLRFWDSKDFETTIQMFGSRVWDIDWDRRFEIVTEIEI